MPKRKFARLAALLTTAVAGGALIANVVIGSGAYFTATQPGSITGNVGTVAVAISGQNINFADLLPGQVQTQTVNVENTGTGNEDMYLVFDNANYAWSAVNDLGQFGKFVISGTTYDNLNNKYAQGTPGSGNMSGACSTVPRNAIAYLPHVISLGTWTPGQTASFNVSFNFIACLTGNGPADLWSSVANDFSPALTGPLPLNFKIAAFQPGVNPTDPFNGAGRIAPLLLPIANYAAGTYQ
jgi:hypothetical protein